MTDTWERKFMAETILSKQPSYKRSVTEEEEEENRKKILGTVMPVPAAPEIDLEAIEDLYSDEVLPAGVQLPAPDLLDPQQGGNIGQSLLYGGVAVTQQDSEMLRVSGWRKGLAQTFEFAPIKYLMKGLSIPLSIAASTAQTGIDVFSGDWESAGRWHNRIGQGYTFGQILHEQNWLQGDSWYEVWGARAIGFTGDMMFDPLNVLGFVGKARYLTLLGKTAAGSGGRNLVAKGLTKTIVEGLDDTTRLYARGGLASFGGQLGGEADKIKLLVDDIAEGSVSRTKTFAKISDEGDWIIDVSAMSGVVDDAVPYTVTLSKGYVDEASGMINNVTEAFFQKGISGMSDEQVKGFSNWMYKHGIDRTGNLAVDFTDAAMPLNKSYKGALVKSQIEADNITVQFGLKGMNRSLKLAGKFGLGKMDNSFGRIIRRAQEGQNLDLRGLRISASTPVVGKVVTGVPQAVRKVAYGAGRGVRGSYRGVVDVLSKGGSNKELRAFARNASSATARRGARFAIHAMARGRHMGKQVEQELRNHARPFIEAIESAKISKAEAQRLAPELMEYVSAGSKMGQLATQNLSAEEVSKVVYHALGGDGTAQAVLKNAMGADEAMSLYDMGRGVLETVRVQAQLRAGSPFLGRVSNYVPRILGHEARDYLKGVKWLGGGRGKKAKGFSPETQLGGATPHEQSRNYISTRQYEEEVTKLADEYMTGAKAGEKMSRADAIAAAQTDMAAKGVDGEFFGHKLLDPNEAIPEDHLLANILGEKVPKGAPSIEMQIAKIMDYEGIGYNLFDDDIRQSLSTYIETVSKRAGTIFAENMLKQDGVLVDQIASLTKFPSRKIQSVASQLNTTFKAVIESQSNIVRLVDEAEKLELMDFQKGLTDDQTQFLDDLGLGANATPEDVAAQISLLKDEMKIHQKIVQHGDERVNKLQKTVDEAIVEQKKFEDESIEVVRRIQEVDEQIASFTSEMKLVNPDDAKGLIEAAKKLDDLEKLRVFLLTENDTGLKYVSGTIKNMADQSLFDLKVKQTISGIMGDEDNFYALQRAFANFRSANHIAETLGDFMARSKDAVFTQNEAGAWQFTHVKPDGSTLVMDETQVEMAFTQLTAYTNRISDEPIGGWVATGLVIADEGSTNLNAMNQLKAIVDESAFQIAQGEMMVKRINELMGSESPFQKLGIGTKKDLPTPANVEKAQNDMKRIVAEERAKHSTDKELQSALNRNEEYNRSVRTYFEVQGAELVRPSTMSANEIESFVRQMEEPVHNMIVALREDIAVKQPTVTVVDVNGRTRTLGVRDYLYYKSTSVATDPKNSFGPPVGSSALPVSVNNIGESIDDILARGEVVSINEVKANHGVAPNQVAHPDSPTELLGPNYENLTAHAAGFPTNYNGVYGNHLNMKVRVVQEDGSELFYSVKVFDWNDATKLEGKIDDPQLLSPAGERVMPMEGYGRVADSPELVAATPRLKAQTQTIGDNMANDLNVVRGKSSQKAPRTRVGQVLNENSAMLKGASGQTITSHNILGKHVVVSRWMDELGELDAALVNPTAAKFAPTDPNFQQMMLYKVDGVYMRRPSYEVVDEVALQDPNHFWHGKDVEILGPEMDYLKEDVVFNAFFNKGIFPDPAMSNSYTLDPLTGELVYMGGSSAGIFGAGADGNFVNLFQDYIGTDPERFTEVLLQTQQILALENAAGGWERYVKKLLGAHASVEDVAKHVDFLNARTDEMLVQLNAKGLALDPNHTPLRRLTSTEGLEKILAEQGFSFEQIDEVLTLPAKTSQASSQTNKLTKGRKPWLSPDGSSQAATTVSVGGGVKATKGMDEKILRTARAKHTQIEAELAEAPAVSSASEWGEQIPYQNLGEAEKAPPLTVAQMEDQAAQRVVAKVRREEFIDISPSAAKNDYPDLYENELNFITSEQLGNQIGESAGAVQGNQALLSAEMKPDLGWNGIADPTGSDVGVINEIIESIETAGGLSRNWDPNSAPQTSVVGAVNQSQIDELTLIDQNIQGTVAKKRALDIASGKVDRALYEWVTEGHALYDMRSLTKVDRNLLVERIKDIASGEYARKRLASGVTTNRTYRSIAETEFVYSQTYAGEYFDLRAGSSVGKADIAGADKLREEWIQTRIGQLRMMEPPREPIFVEPNSTVKVVIYDKDGNVVMRMPVDEVGSAKKADWELVSANVGDQDPVVAATKAAYDQIGQKVEIVSWMDDPKLVDQGEQVFVARLVNDPLNPEVGQGINYDPQFQDRVLRFNHVAGGLSARHGDSGLRGILDFLNFSYHQSPKWFDQNSLNAVLFNHMYMLPQTNMVTGGLLMDAQGNALKVYGILPENQEKVNHLLRVISEGNLSSEELASVYDRLNRALYNPANSSYGRGSVHTTNIAATQTKLDMVAKTLDPFGAAGDDMYNRIRYEASRAVDGVSIDAKGKVQLDPNMQRLIEELKLWRKDGTFVKNYGQTIRGTRKYSFHSELLSKHDQMPHQQGIELESQVAGARAIARSYTQARVNKLSEIVITTMKRLDNIGSRAWNGLSQEQKILFMGFLDHSAREADTAIGDWLPKAFRFYDTAGGAITINQRKMRIKHAESAFSTMRAMSPEDLDDWVSRYLAEITPLNGATDGAEAWTRLYGQYMNSPVMKLLIGKQSSNADDLMDLSVRLEFEEDEIWDLPFLVRDSLNQGDSLETKGFFEYVGDGWKNANRLDTNTAGYHLSPKELREKIVDLFDPTKQSTKDRVKALNNLRKLIAENPELVSQHEATLANAQNVLEEMSGIFEVIRSQKFRFRQDVAASDPALRAEQLAQQKKYASGADVPSKFSDEFAVYMPQELEASLIEMSGMYRNLLEGLPEDVLAKADLPPSLFPEEFDELLEISSDNMRNLVQADVSDVTSLRNAIRNTFEIANLGRTVPPDTDPLGDIPLFKHYRAKAGNNSVHPDYEDFFNPDGTLKDGVDFEELVTKLSDESKAASAVQSLAGDIKQGLAFYLNVEDINAIATAENQLSRAAAQASMPNDDIVAFWWGIQMAHGVDLNANKNLLWSVIDNALTDPQIVKTLTPERLTFLHTISINHLAKFGQTWDNELLTLVEKNFKEALSVAERETVGIVSARSQNVQEFFDDMERILTETGSLSGDFEKVHQQGFDYPTGTGPRVDKDGKIMRHPITGEPLPAGIFRGSETGQELGLMPPTRTLPNAGVDIQDGVFALQRQMGKFATDLGAVAQGRKHTITDPAQLLGTRTSTEMLASDIWDTYKIGLASEGYSATAWQNWEHATMYPTKGIHGDAPLSPFGDVPTTTKPTQQLAAEGGVRTGNPTNVNIMLTNPAMIAKDRTAFIAETVSETETVLRQTQGTVGQGTLDGFPTSQVTQQEVLRGSQMPEKPFHGHQTPHIQGGAAKTDVLPIRHFMEEYEKLINVSGKEAFSGDEKVAEVIAAGGDKAEAVLEMLALQNLYMEKAKLIKLSDSYIPTRKMMAEGRVKDLQNSLRELISLNEQNISALKPYQELTQRATAVIQKSEKARQALDEIKAALKAGEITQPNAEELLNDLKHALDVLDDANFSDIDRQVKETIIKGRDEASSIGVLNQEITDPFKGATQLTIDDVLEQADEIVIPLGKKNQKKHAQAFDKTFKSGMKAFGTGLSGPEGLVDAMSAVTRYETMGGARNWVKHYDKVHNLLKGYMIAKPSFHLRNFYSGAFMNYLGGVSVGSYRRFQNAYWADNLAYAQEQGWDHVVKKIERQVRRRVQVTKASPEDIATIRQMRENGLLGKNMTQTGMEFEATNIQIGGKKVSLKRGLQQVNPFNSNNAFLRLSKDAGIGTEAFLRGTMAFDGLVKGGSMEEVFDNVIKYHFDYDDLSSFERKVIKRIFPFYVWTKRAVPLMLEEIFRNPKKMARFEHFKSELQGYDEDQKGVPVPDYFKRQGGVSLPIKYEGQNMWWLPDFPQKAPMELIDPMAGSLFNLATGKNKGSAVSQVQETLGQALSTIMPMTSPLIKAPLELATNRNFWHGYDFNGSYQPVPTAYANVPLLMPVLQFLGMAHVTREGNWIMSDSNLNAVATMLPTLSDMRRLFPSEERYQQRTLSTWLSFTFGLGVRTNTLWEQDNVLQSRMWDIIEKNEEERKRLIGEYKADN